MVRIGLIGAGTMGRAHAESIQHLNGVQLTAVADTEIGKAHTLAEPHQAVPLSEAGELVNRDDVDAVIVASPTPFHYAHAKAAMENGKHVFLEMPMVRRIEEGEELIQLAQERKITLTIDHNLRYFLEYAAIKQKIDEGAVGKPGVIRLGRRTSHPRNWYSNFESSGGVILDAMVHEIDFLLWCFGPARRVFCQGLHERLSTEQLDYALAIIRMQSGAIAHIESSWSHYGQYAHDVEIAGDKGLLRSDNQSSIPLRLSLTDWQTGGRRYFSESPVQAPACFNLLKAFLCAIKGEGKNPVPGAEALEVVRLALATIESVESKQPITLNA